MGTWQIFSCHSSTGNSFTYSEASLSDESERFGRRTLLDHDVLRYAHVVVQFRQF